MRYYFSKLDILMVVIVLLMIFVGPIKAANDSGTNYVSQGFSKARSVIAEQTACLYTIQAANTVYKFSLPSSKIPISLSVRNTHATAQVYVDATRTTCYNKTGTGASTAADATFNLGEAVAGLRAGDIIVFTTTNADQKPYTLASVTSTSIVELAEAPTLTTASQAWSITSARVSPGETRSFDVAAGPIALQANTASTGVELTLGYQRED
jgi:hypothetical protein